MIELVVFLGNYGKEYHNTRHNTAWLFEESLPFADKLSWQDKFKGEFASVDFSDFAAWLLEASLIKPRSDGSLPLAQEAPKRLHFLKPLTYMNLSGESIGEAARFYKIPPENILVVHDEIELAPGFVSFKWGGGLGGHNGLRSAKAVLGTGDFFRLRLGIGKCSNGSIADYVLGSFSQDEMIRLSQLFTLVTPLFAKALISKDAKVLVSEWGKKKLVD